MTISPSVRYIMDRLGVDTFTAQAVAKALASRDGPQDVQTYDWDDVAARVADRDRTTKASLDVILEALGMKEGRSRDPQPEELVEPRSITLARLDTAQRYWAALRVVARIWDAHPDWSTKHVLHQATLLEPALRHNLDRFDRVRDLTMQGREAVDSELQTFMPDKPRNAQRRYPRLPVGFSPQGDVTGWIFSQGQWVPGVFHLRKRAELYPHGRDHGPRKPQIPPGARSVKVHVPTARSWANVWPHFYPEDAAIQRRQRLGL